MKHQKRYILILITLGILFLGSCTKTTEIQNNVSVSFIACGDADVSLIEYENHFILIDTGENTCENKVLAYLEQKSIEDIDFIILTHPDKDHIGNTVAIMQNYNVKKVYMSNYEKGSTIEKDIYDYMKTNNIDYEILTTSLNLNISELAFNIEPPLSEYDSSNNSSLVTWMNLGDVTFFFGGDIKKNRIEELLNKDLKKATIVKMPYHGRYISNMKELLEGLNPEFIVITSTNEDEETNSLLETMKIKYEYINKDIVITTNGVTWAIE